MKKAFLVIALSAISICTFSQKCNLAKDEKDKFTGNTVKLSKEINSDGMTITTNKPKIAYYLERQNKDLSIGFTIKAMGKLESTVSKDKEMIILLNDNTNIKVYSVEDKVPDYRIQDQRFIFSYYTFKCQCTSADLDKIAASGIKSIRINIAVQPWDFEFKDKKVEESKKYATCIIAN